MFDENGAWIPLGSSGFQLPSYRGMNIAAQGIPGLNNVNAGGAVTAPLTSPSAMLGQQAYSPVTGIADAANPALAAANPAFDLWSADTWLGKPGQQGLGSLALGAANGLMGGFIGMQQLGIAKDTLAQNKKQFDLNFGAQQKMTNSRLADRQATRIASGFNVAPVDDYMKKYGI
jgi:hypothetical protein